MCTQMYVCCVCVRVSMCTHMQACVYAYALVCVSHVSNNLQNLHLNNDQPQTHCWH